MELSLIVCCSQKSPLTRDDWLVHTFSLMWEGPVPAGMLLGALGIDWFLCTLNSHHLIGPLALLHCNVCGPKSMLDEFPHAILMKLRHVWYQGTSSLMRLKEFHFRERSAVFTFHALNYVCISHQPKSLYLRIRNRTLVSDLHIDLLTLLNKKVSFFSTVMFHLVFF